MKILRILSPVLAGLFIFISCSPKHKQVLNRTVVQVDGTSLSAKDFAELLVRQLKDLDALSAKDPNNIKRTKEKIIADFILEALVLSYAKDNSITINDDELEKEINSFRSSYPDDLAFRRVLADEGLSFVSWKESLRKTLLHRRVIAKITENVAAPNDSEIAKYYQDNKEKFKRAERVFLRQIVVDELPKAEEIRKEARSKDFATLAKKYSVAPEAKFGGELGWIEKGSIDVFNKAFSLSIGGISPVLESAYGFHIFKVERKLPAGFAQLSEVRSIVEDSLRGQREQALFSSWLDQQIRKSRVLRDNSLLDSMSVETLGKD